MVNTPLQLSDAVVEIINSTDEAAMRRLLEVWLSPRMSDSQREALAQLFARIKQQGDRVRRFQEEPAGRGTFLRLWSDSIDKGVLLYVESDPDVPAHIAVAEWLVAIHPEAEIKVQATPPTDTASLVQAIAAECSRLASADELSGAVLVAHEDQILYHNAFGLADREAARPITMTTRFHQASMSKMFTSVATVQLVEAGKLTLNDCVGDLLPDFAWTEEAKAVTVSQLLSHTAGFGMLFDRPDFSYDKDYQTCGELVALFAGSPLRFPPGLQWSYSNEGFEVLGAIIEKLGSQPYIQYVRENLLQPAHMLSTDAIPTNEQAIAYASAENDPFGIEPRLANERLGRCSGSGGFYGTAGDLLRFARALHNGALVSPDTLDLFATPRHRFPGPSEAWYGYGFTTFEPDGRRVFGHSGGGSGSGVCNCFTTFADGSYTVVTLTNYDPPLGEKLNRAIVDGLARQQKVKDDLG